MTDACKRGEQWGAYYRNAGIDYGKVNGHYPSNPYCKGSAEANDYDAAYEASFSA